MDGDFPLVPDALAPGAIREKHAGLLFLRSVDAAAGAAAARDLLYAVSDGSTLLFLSGGKTPAGLYSILARESLLKAGAAALVDERYGEPLHSRSNHLMVLRTGLLEYFQRQGIPFHPILAGSPGLEEAARTYGRDVAELFGTYSRRVAILGVGVDGHIAGIAPNRPDFNDPLFAPGQKELLVSAYSDPRAMSSEGESAPPYGFGQRITMTIKALSAMTILIVLAFGDRKRAALRSLAGEGPLEEAPARFVRAPDVACKTLIITDQRV